MAKRSAHTSQAGTKPTTVKRRRTSKGSSQAVCTSEGSHDSHAEDEEGDQQSDDEDEAASGSPGHSLVACQNCRRRKSKCSKTHPCSQCVKLNVACLYHTRGRPGLKIGAVESLANRLSDLEQMFLGQSMLLQSCLLGDRTQSSPALNSLAAQSALLRDRCLGSAHLASSPPPAAVLRHRDRRSFLGRSAGRRVRAGAECYLSIAFVATLAISSTEWWTGTLPRCIDGSPSSTGNDSRSG
ncbi:hypothetical protein L1887_54882 [Cichorium endivia]|nr:hypothetical protein L1887_54882 [Cichorium endivia]